jgi:hypothetical protein
LFVKVLYFYSVQAYNIVMDKKVNVVLEWVATVFVLAGAVATSLGFDPANIYLFNAGSLLWFIWAVRVKKPSLMVVNFGLLAVYCVGLLLRA